ncbi:bifunctional (p)ppGpp synthetase/guanosine-3',5'-bis(diphosphate) 3'-pyrophosphohydrolase [Romeria aff. gracilis LEGE 07310]|uniref:Bifunctional (P)ppGpp synthetase/guanosine-3',5'-bis(Diphosphate) 3'-pyrophosphohydrolase n=1 Tax=Vasconcelosia minhoensis LEGE 07310 TaxID=915328 RepID=A0A8J7AK39_9CYAN|nr:bifunctional (p)ppGpp synthetase/guanosine-3',5'-bis(diphosphate) 3'-pyrophosphohydrolase [Romeria gracilis]MBE9079123.1 bifunctional (p)ppGpp synthetase/guanosine-3',5'-bis(diphosphate) 3'-pyrophosphohydrolase [Romeria aff. gracilis LEGE 07310]
MNVTAPALPSDCTLPNWLEDCILDQHQSADGQSAEGGAEGSAHKDNNQLVCRAFEFAYQLHKGQMRASGEPYIAHPVAVAGLLRGLGGDSAMIAAGFLHDVVEDTEVTAEEIENLFGAEVRQLVEGVTKLSKFNFRSKRERQAENFRRMFLAMAQDIRVIVVKLADRLHNMRTLEHLPPEKQRRIARETAEIFAPLANRLGIGRFKWELEDLSFKYLEPEAYGQLRGLVVDKRADRENRLKQVAAALRDRLSDIGIQCHEVSSRPKHLYSIYRKMERQQKDFHEIYDIAAVRLIVGTNDECYRALAVVHDLYRPIPGRFKDYIGLPKPNRYQSLHTVVIGSHGRPIEVQIRTIEMHHIAEYGIAAHWKYKETGNSNIQVSSDDEKFTWLRQLLDWQSDLKDAQEYLTDVKDNLFDEEVYVFTPDGDVLPLSRNATPVDFAYRIHTEVGNHCSGAKVNGRMVTLDTELQNGDIVEIITQKNAHPNLDWLNFVVSAGARNRIRQWYKRSHRDENLARGRDMLEKVMGKNGLEALLKSASAQAAAERCNYSSVEDLLAGLGYGEVTLNSTVNRLQEAVKAAQPIQTESQTAESPVESLEEELAVSKSTLLNKASRSATSQSPIIGVEGLLHHIAGCCNPLPGESIIGVVALASRGIAIHRQGCPNLESMPGERLIPVSWNSTEFNTGRPNTYPVQVKIEVIDRVGVLKDILSHLSDLKINVHKAGVKTFPGQTAEIELGIDVRDHAHLNKTFNQIRKMSDVLKLRRVSELE